MGLFKKILYKLSGTTEEIQEIYMAKGVCDEYVDAYAAYNKNPTPYRKCIIADFYTTVGRYAEAERLLDSVKVNIATNDDVRGIAYLERITLYCRTKRFAEAEEIFEKNQRFLDIYFTSASGEKIAGSYYGNAAGLLAHAGNENGAYDYLANLKAWTMKHQPEFPITWNLVYVLVLKFLGNELAQLEYEETKRKIEAYTGYEREWQKEHLLKQLDNIYFEGVF